MTTEVTINGQAYTDGVTSGSVLGMDNGGHSTNFMLLIEDLLTVLAGLNGYGVTSVTSITIGTGAKGPFTTSPSATAYAANTLVKALSAADPTKYIIGPVVSHAAGVLNITGVYSNGAGAVTDWIIVPYNTAPFPANAAGFLLNDGSGGFSFSLSGASLTGIRKQGKETFWIPAPAAKVRSSNGAAPAAIVETATHKINFNTLDFDASSIEYAQSWIWLPKSYNGGTITAIPVWKHAATATNFKVSWGLQGVVFPDDTDGDTAFGTAQYSNDTGGTTNKVYIGPETAAITLGGTPAGNRPACFQMSRKADDATNDTLAIDAGLIGWACFYTTNAADDT